MTLAHSDPIAQLFDGAESLDLDDTLGAAPQTDRERAITGLRDLSPDDTQVRGRLTLDDVDKLILNTRDTLLEFENVFEHIQPPKRKKPVEFVEFDGLITGWQLYAVNRWQYSFYEVRWDREDFTWNQRSDGFTSTVGVDDFARPAWNRIESRNTASVVAPGLHVGASTYPSGFAWKPIGGDDNGSIRILVPVQMRAYFLGGVDEGNPYLFDFQLTGIEDGSCE